MKRKNIIIMSVLVLLIFSCSTTKMLILKNELNISQKKEFSVSNITIEAPEKGQNVFTFRDIKTFSLPGTYVEGGGVGIYMPDGEAVTINRANFEYYLSENSDTIFYDALSTMLRTEQTSPYTLRCKADFSYYLPKREFLSNILGISMRLNMVIIKDSVEVFENNYEVAEEEEYSTAWVTIPGNDLMNGLFNKAVNKIMDQLVSDNRIEEALKNNEH